MVSDTSVKHLGENHNVPIVSTVMKFLYLLLRYAKTRTRILIFCIAVFAGISPVLSAENMTLNEFTSEMGLQLQWDPVSSRGILTRDDVYLGFFPGVPFASVNFREIIPIPPVTWGSHGSLVISPETQQVFRDVFPEKPAPPAGQVTTIFIDPGHGGKDPGAIGRHEINGSRVEVMEKDVVLDVSLRLKNLLSSRYPEIDIVMSREDDRYIELIDRYEMANALTAERNDSTIFISIHANASINTGARGFEVWYLSPEFRRTLITETDVSTSGEIVPILNSMLEEEITIQSIMLGRTILSGLQNHLGYDSINRGLKQETFAVVRGARMPSVLVEIGFLTNNEEFRLLQDERHLQEIAEGIYNGVNEFINSF